MASKEEQLEQLFEKLHQLIAQQSHGKIVKAAEQST
jgi:hypothetical protein